MQIDRFVRPLMKRGMSQIAKSGLPKIPGIRDTISGKTVPPARDPDDDLRGSGSWANEWVGARAAMERARGLAKKRPGAKAKTPADVIPEGSIRRHALMPPQAVRLYDWIADRLEAEAPNFTLHAGVAVGAFLASDEAHPEHDPLAGMIVDLLVADAQGHAVVVLVRENLANPARQLMMLDALLDAEIPIVDIQPRPSLSTLWPEIYRHLPQT